VRYIGALLEREVVGSTTTWRHHVSARGRVVAQVNRVSSTNVTVQYLHRDHAGSVVEVTSAAGAIVQSLAYDAWGLRRGPANWAPLGSPFGGTQPTERGYTGHEHLDTVELVHMNGRVQDPKLGLFISADPFVQAPYHSQSHNRYAYVWNNPVSMIDPSGFQTCDNGFFCDGADYDRLICLHFTWQNCTSNSYQDGYQGGNTGGAPPLGPEGGNPPRGPTAVDDTPTPQGQPPDRDWRDYFSRQRWHEWKEQWMEQARRELLEPSGMTPEEQFAYDMETYGWVLNFSGTLRGKIPVGPVGVGRSLDDILKDDKLFSRWLRHKHPVGRALSVDDALKVWNRIIELGQKPDLHPGHPRRTWDQPHITLRVRASTFRCRLTS
jgi:RHS repeat-associated protein